MIQASEVHLEVHSVQSQYFTAALWPRYASGSMVAQTKCTTNKRAAREPVNY